MHLLFEALAEKLAIVGDRHHQLVHGGLHEERAPEAALREQRRKEEKWREPHLLVRLGFPHPQTATWGDSGEQWWIPGTAEPGE